MTVASIFSRAVSSYIPSPKILVRFRLLRDGESTSLEKKLYLYDGWDSMGQLVQVFWAEPGEGEFTSTVELDLAYVLSKEFLAFGRDDSVPRRVRAAYLSLQESGTFVFNITSPVDKPEGFGYLAGEFPDGITTRLDTPISATIKVLHTTADGRTGKVAETVSNPDGTWAVHGLDPSKKFDVICSLAGFNDLILSKVSPTPY